MQLTRRGYGVVAIVVIAELFAITYGARALNAVAAPLLVALLAAAVQVRRTDVPTAERSAVAPGFPGDVRDVTVDVDGSGVARITETVGEGDPPHPLAAVGASVEATLPTTFTYALTCQGRGRHTVGPLVVRVRDVLGLVEVEHRAGSTGDVLVYPPVYKVAGQEGLFEHVLDRSDLERREFDSLREYVPGDPLRDVHWKTTAKNPDEIFVTEFTDRHADEDVVIAASSANGYADEMATAAASIAVMALEADLRVELAIPEGTVPLGFGIDHRETILEALAVTDGGELPGDAPVDPDIEVRADHEGVAVTFGTRTESLEAITVSRENPLATREVRP